VVAEIDGHEDHGHEAGERTECIRGALQDPVISSGSLGIHYLK